MRNVPSRESHLLACAVAGMILFPLVGLAVITRLVPPPFYVALSLVAFGLVVGALAKLETPFA